MTYVLTHNMVTGSFSRSGGRKMENRPTLTLALFNCHQRAVKSIANNAEFETKEMLLEQFKPKMCLIGALIGAIITLAWFFF